MDSVLHSFVTRQSVVLIVLFLRLRTVMTTTAVHARVRCYALHCYVRKTFVISSDRLFVYSFHCQWNEFIVTKVKTSSDLFLVSVI